jgi:hypothetical protein
MIIYTDQDRPPEHWLSASQELKARAQSRGDSQAERHKTGLRMVRKIKMNEENNDK